MKKPIVYAILAMLSTSAFGATNLTCGVFDKSIGGKAIKTLSIDTDRDYASAEVKLNENRIFHVEKINDLVNISFGGPTDFIKNVFPVEVVWALKETGSIGLQNYNPVDKERHYQTICYNTGDSTVAPWEL